MNHAKRHLAAWLCTLLVIPAAVSCADAGTVTETPTTDTAAADTEVVTEAVMEATLEGAIARMEGTDFGGYEFRVMDRSDEADPNWVTIDVWSEGEDGDTINDAVFRRNRALEEGMNIVISENQVKYPYENAKTAIMSGTDEFDVFTDGLSYLATMAVEGYLVDLNTIDTLKLGNPWWDQDLSRDLSIRNKLFFCTGDISIMDNYGTWCIMFNKDLAEEYDLDNIYDHVKAGTWTLDTMYSMSRAVTKDLDGDGVQKREDQWGFLTEGYNGYGMWAAGGHKITGKVKDDYPMLTAYSDRSVSTMELVSEFTQDKAASLVAENTEGGCGFTNEHFGQGNALFIYGGMWLITKYRGYDVNFGVVPAPKFDLTQDRYYSTHSNGNCTAYSIPTTAKDLSRTGKIMESMAEVSKFILTPAYTEVALKGKYIRDEESAEMLDYILFQRTFDLGMIFNWGNMFGNIINISFNAGTDFASTYARDEKAALADIEKFISALDSLE
ncbi:MAG: extracellular solute-binding protein [Clostridia bacterium]|nr:extracellular solute-binding protein [Clostridia bacterium]